jgi:general secretion pathway protein K
VSRRGFALLTVLWLIAALSAVSAAALAIARVGASASYNRVLLTRAEWARAACAEILVARYTMRDSIAPLGTIDLGNNVWCRAMVEEAGSRLDLNLAPPEALRILIGNDSLTDALLDWRDPDSVPRPRGAEAGWYGEQGGRGPRNGPLADIAELLLVRGFDSARVGRLAPFVTTLGTSRIDLNIAPPEVLATIPGVTPATIAAIVARREAHRPIHGTEELMSLLLPPEREALLKNYQEFTARAAYAPSRVVARVEGGIGPSPLVGVEHLTLVPAPGRLAVVRRRVE